MLRFVLNLNPAPPPPTPPYALYALTDAKFEAAIEMAEQAANVFKMNKKWDRCVHRFLRA